MVLPPASIAAVWAAVSIPSASPLTMITPCCASVLESLEAILSPSSDGFLVPMIATLGWGNGSSIFPATKSLSGAYFCSISLRAPRSSSDETQVFRDPPSDELTPREVAPIPGTPTPYISGTSNSWNPEGGETALGGSATTAATTDYRRL